MENLEAAPVRSNVQSMLLGLILLALLAGGCWSGVSSRPGHRTAEATSETQPGPELRTWLSGRATEPPGSAEPQGEEAKGLGAAYAGEIPTKWSAVRQALLAAGLPLRQELAARWANRLAQVGTPLREGGEVAFFYYGAAQKVALTGDMTAWQPVPMSRLPGTELWTTTLPIPTGAVAGYRLLVDGRSQPDPLNSRTSVAMDATWSLYVGPEAPGREPPPAGSARGRWASWEMESKALGRWVLLQAFIPEGCTGARPCQALIAADGPFYLGEGRLAEVTSSLTEHEGMPPLVVIGVKPPRNPILRSVELLPGFLGDAWPQFVTQELVPEVRRRLPVSWGRTGLIGLSAGGGAMLQVLLEHPGPFSWAIIQSPAALPPVLEEAIACARGIGHRIWLTWGAYETNVFGLNIREHAAALAHLLRGRGFEVAGGERPAGHTMGAWRRDLPAALMWVTGVGPEGAEGPDTEKGSAGPVRLNVGSTAPAAGSAPCSAGT